MNIYIPNNLNDLIYQSLKLTGTKESLFAPGSKIGKQFDIEYERWMNTRAKKGDIFALSLGYGEK